MNKIVISALTVSAAIATSVSSGLLGGGGSTPANSSYIFAAGTAPFNASLSCFSCIRNNYIYCVKAADHVIVSSGKPEPQGVCCSTYQTCPQISDPSYTCSSTYTDPFLAIRMCPFKSDACGQYDSTVLTKSG